MIACPDQTMLLHGLLDGELDAANALACEAHLKTCENCSALVRDLEYIAQQAKLLLPIHDPSPEVWENIQVALKKEPSRK